MMLLTVRMTDDEHAALKVHAASVGLTMSDFVRERLRAFVDVKRRRGGESDG
jgi:plasmid stability protein